MSVLPDPLDDWPVLEWLKTDFVTLLPVVMLLCFVWGHHLLSIDPYGQRPRQVFVHPPSIGRTTRLTSRRSGPGPPRYFLVS